MLGIKNVRLPEYDYQSDGYYFVTIGSHFRRINFDGLEDVVEKIFREVAQALRGVTIDTIIIMPDHVHVLYCLRNSSHTLGEIVRRCKAKTSYILGGRMWKPNYYEHVVRDEQDLNRIRTYIIMNREITELRKSQSI